MNSTKQQVRAACYCRISSDPKDKREGVDRQKEDTAALCQLKGWEVVEVYVDNDRSASNGKKREAWERLLGDIRAGKVDAVAAWDQDRMNRMMADFEAYKGLFVERGIKLATSNNGDIDLTTPSGVMTAQIKTAVAEHEIAMMRIRMRRAGRQRAEKGLPQWKQSFGYKRATNEGDDGTRTKDPKAAKLVVAAYKAVLANTDGRAKVTVTNIAAAWNAKGITTPTGKAWNPSLVSQLLRSPRNAALRTYTHDCRALGHGNDPCDLQGTLEVIGKGTWPPLVEEETWREAVAMLDARPGASQRRPVRQHLLTGVLKCGNPSVKVMLRDEKSGEVVKDANGKVTYISGGPCEGGFLSGMRTMTNEVVYTCKTCRGSSIRASHVEPLVFGTLAGRLTMPDAVDLLKRGGHVHDSVEAERLRAERKVLTDRLDTIADERADGDIDGAGYKRMTARVREQIAVIDRQQENRRMKQLFDGMELGTPNVAEQLKTLSRDRLRAVTEVLVTITVNPVGRGHRVNGERFDRDRVTFDWHDPQEGQNGG